MRDGDPGALPAYATVGADVADLEVWRVLERRQLCGKGACGGLVEAGRGFLAEGLVGPVVVELPSEVVEAVLLSDEIGL